MTAKYTLIWAAENGDSETVDVLLKNSVIRDIKRSDGKTAIDLAHEKGFENVIDLLTQQLRIALEACNVYSKSLPDKIWGGELANSGEFPWMVAIGYIAENSFSDNYEVEFRCGEIRDDLSESQYCTHDPNGSGDSCEGDSGGPIQIVQQYSTVAKVVAVVSFGSTCGSSLPSINTRVAYYLDWIESLVWPNSTISANL